MKILKFNFKNEVWWMWIYHLLLIALGAVGFLIVWFWR
jgi:hypothetical protein